MPLALFVHADLVLYMRASASPYTGLSDAWGVGQHLEHRSSGLSESDVLFLWLLCAARKCFDHLQAHQTLDQPAYASMRS